MTTRLKNKLVVVREQIREAYSNGATLQQIAEAHNVSAGTVRNVLLEMGTSFRPRGRRRKQDMVDSRILPLDFVVEGEETFEDNLSTEKNYEGGVF